MQEQKPDTGQFAETQFAERQFAERQFAETQFAEREGQFAEKNSANCPCVNFREIVFRKIVPYPFKINLGNIGMWRVIYKLGQCISNFIDHRKLYGFMGSTRGIVRFMTALPREL